MIPTKDNDDFLDFVDDYDSHYDDSSYSEHDDEDDDGFSGQLLDEDYDDDELERRRVAYAGLKKNDKIFNNTYNMGLDTSEEDDDLDSNAGRAGGPEIKLDSSAPDYHLYDPERYADHVDQKIIRKDIDNFIIGCPSVQEILGNDPEKKKFTKLEINSLFELINNGLSKGGKTNVFVSPIHVLDSISSTVSMEYKKIFDMLTYENKEILLLELNAKYGFLDNVSKNYKMF
jgi:hypothetical protein